MDRQHFLSASFAALISPAGPETQLAALERRAGGRLGVFALDTGSGQTIAHRAHERFPMCSTFKLLLVAAVLRRVEEHNEDLSRRVAVGESDILAYAPIAKAHLSLGSMTIAELCAAAIEWSDNTCANLLLHSILGPAGVTKFARTLGDRVTRLDRNEPSLNTAIPGDPRDTTSPAAMAADVRALVLGTALTPRSRARLRTWLIACKTGTNALRAGMPHRWTAGDKTGSGERATSNDVAIFWPPSRAPVIVAAYFTNSTASEAMHATVLPSVARIARTAFAPDQVDYLNRP